MADKVDKPKKKGSKSKREEKGVMSALPSTRPDRIGGRRDDAPTAKTTPTNRSAAMENSPTPSKNPAAPKTAPAPEPAAPPAEGAAERDPVIAKAEPGMGEREQLEAAIAADEPVVSAEPVAKPKAKAPPTAK